jgi:hypothetical protein
MQNTIVDWWKRIQCFIFPYCKLCNLFRNYCFIILIYIESDKTKELIDVFRRRASGRRRPIDGFAICTAPNKPVHGKPHLKVLCGFSSLLRAFLRSAADRFVRAHARPNRVDRRPLGASFCREHHFVSARASGRRAHI